MFDLIQGNLSHIHDVQLELLLSCILYHWFPIILCDTSGSLSSAADDSIDLFPAVLPNDLPTHQGKTPTNARNPHKKMPFFKPPSYMQKAKTMENKPYGWDLPNPSKQPAEPSKDSKQTPNMSSDTLAAAASPTKDNDEDDGDATSADHRKEPLSAVERIKLEREYEKAHPKEPIMPAKGVWKSKWMVVPAAVLYGFGGG